MEILRIINKGTDDRIKENAYHLQKAFTNIGHNYVIENLNKNINHKRFKIFHISGEINFYDLINYKKNIYKNRIIYEISDTQSIKTGNNKANFFKRKQNLIAKKFIDDADILLINESLIETGQNESVKKLPGIISLNKKKKLFITKSGIDVHEAPRLEHSQFTLGFNIIYPNPIERRSNMHKLIETMKYLPSNTCAFVTGNVNDQTYCNEMINYIKNLNLENRIIFRLLKSLNEYHNSMAIGVSFYEGNIIDSGTIEVMLSGIPFVTNVDYGFPLQGIDYVNTGSGKNLSKLLKDIMTQSPVQVDVSYLKKAFSWESRAKEMLQVYSYAEIK